MGSLSGKVAVVTGASRGVGKGIAVALADKGATVYVTGRTVAPGAHPLPGTVGDTAAEVDRRGGKGIAVPVDHGQDEQVAALFEKVKQEQGRLDILVNNAFALPEDLTVPKPFWEKPLSNWEMVDIGVRSNFVAAWHAAQIMVPQGSGLIVATSGYVGVTYTYGVIFGTCKSAVDRMARDMAVELKPAQRGLDIVVAGAYPHRAGGTQPQKHSRDDLADRHRPQRRFLGRVPRSSDRSPRHRSGRDEAVRRHVHRRRARA